MKNNGRLIWILVALALVVSQSGCASPASLTLRAATASAGDPLPGARVRSVVREAGLVPLPVTLDTLEERAVATAERRTVFADAEGNAKLEFLAGRVAIIEIAPSPLRAPPPRPGVAPAVRYLFSPDPPSLERLDSLDGEAPDITATIQN